VAVLAKLGFQVTASTGRPEEPITSKALGAHEIIERKELAGPVRALAKERWIGGVDAVGSTDACNILSMIRYRGAVAACGLAGGMDLPTMVAPFILEELRFLCRFRLSSAGRSRRSLEAPRIDLDRATLCYDI